MTATMIHLVGVIDLQVQEGGYADDSILVNGEPLSAAIRDRLGATCDGLGVKVSGAVDLRLDAVTALEEAPTGSREAWRPIGTREREMNP